MCLEGSGLQITAFIGIYSLYLGALPFSRDIEFIQDLLNLSLRVTWITLLFNVAIWYGVYLREEVGKYGAALDFRISVAGAR